MAGPRTHPVKRSSHIPSRRREVHRERVTEAEGGQQCRVAQQLRNLVGRGGDNSRAFEHVLQTWQLRKDRLHRRYLHVPSEESRELELAGRTTQIATKIVAVASIKTRGGLVLKPGAKAPRREINADWNVQSLNC